MEGDSVSRVFVVYVVVFTLRYAFPPTLKSKKEKHLLFPTIAGLNKKNVYCFAYIVYVSFCLPCLILAEHQKLKCNETVTRK